MPDVAGGWVHLLFGTLGGIWGGKLYILGVAGYNKHIWDVLALEGEREEAGEHIDSPKLINFFPIRQLLPVGLALACFCSWARWVWFFTVERMFFFFFF